MAEISEKRRHRARFRLACFSLVSLAALGTLVPAIGELSSEVVRTGFGQFLSLMLSDSGTLAAYWQDFAMIVVESFPIIGVSAVLASILAFLASARLAVKNKNIAFT
jgi:phage-related minor tail protein